MAGEKISVPLAVGAIVSAGVFSSIVTYLLFNSKGSSEDDTIEPKKIMNCIVHRRSIFPKQYSEKPVDKSVIVEMLEAARWAPTHNLTEPWKFIVFSSKESLESLVRLCLFWIAQVVVPFLNPMSLVSLRVNSWLHNTKLHA